MIVFPGVLDKHTFRKLSESFDQVFGRPFIPYLVSSEAIEDNLSIFLNMKFSVSYREIRRNYAI